MDSSHDSLAAESLGVSSEGKMRTEFNVDKLDDTNESKDMELGGQPASNMMNELVLNYAWQNINVSVKDRVTNKPLSILSDASGIVHAGEMLAIMGPSGSGKTTLLNAIAHRLAAAGATTTGSKMANGQTTNLAKIRDLSSYVEQDDALIGSLTVKETMQFAASLALSKYVFIHRGIQQLDHM